MLVNKRKYDELEKHHIFPRKFLEEKLEPEDPDTEEHLVNNLANITLIHYDINEKIGDTPPSEYLKEYTESVEKHFIPKNSNLWEPEQYESFLDDRISQIYSAGKEFFGDIFEEEEDK